VRLLLDTQVILWEMGDARRVSPSAEQAIAEADELWTSVLTFAEVGIKTSIGKLAVPPDFRHRIEAAGVSVLPLDVSHGLAVADLPLHHRDPFDRLLVAQARSEGLTLVTADRRLAAYDVPVVDAR